MGVSVIQHLCFYMKVLIVTLVLDIDVEKFMNFGLYNVKLHGLEFDISMSWKFGAFYCWVSMLF